MHLLFVTSLLPDARPASGFEIATRAIVDALGAAGVRLTIAGFRRPGAGLPETGSGLVALGDLAIENAGAGPLRKLAWVADAVRRGLPVSAAKLAGLGANEFRRRLAAAGPVDGIVLNSVQMPAAYPFLQEALPSIFVAHNVEHLSARENAQNAAALSARLLYAREARLLQRAEAGICRRAAVVFTLAEADRQGLGLGLDPRALTLPLSVGRPARGDDGARARDVGLIGTWSWAPNRVGLDWFLREVAPLLPPDVSVGVAGQFDGPPPAAPPNVRFHGRVPDAQGFVRESRVVALATKGGTGVQLKTIETLEEGMPAVATPQALRGVGGARPGNLRVADEPRLFAEALLDLVAAERSGRPIRLDGQGFAQTQADGLRRGVEAGLALFAAALPGRAREERPRIAASWPVAAGASVR